MFLKSKKRRLHRRHIVNWEALLEVTSPDFHDQIQVKVVNFSSGGALLHSEQISVGNQHLVISAQKPELKLKILLPEMELESRVKIEWYKPLEEGNHFEIGIGFIDFLEKNSDLVDKLIKFLEKNK